MANEPPSIRDRIYLALHIIPGGSLLFALVPLVIFGYLGWYYYAAERIDRTFYSLKADQIEISSQPDWLSYSVLEEVFSKKRLDRINLLDPSANADIVSAFETDRAVKSATGVRKFSNTVFVDLIYRQPVALISVPQDQSQEQSGSAPNPKGFSVFALDVDGYVVPVSEEFAHGLIAEFLKIDIEDVGAPLPSGETFRYADARVHQALKLATYLAASGQQENLGLQWMYVHRDNEVTSGRTWLLLLRTADNRQIVWGHAPGDEIGGEEAAEKKLARLAEWLKSTSGSSTEGGWLDLSRNPSTGQTVSIGNFEATTLWNTPLE